MLYEVITLRVALDIWRVSSYAGTPAALEGQDVITSYSIHYTKLYDRCRRGRLSRTADFAASGLRIDLDPDAGRPQTLAEIARTRRPHRRVHRQDDAAVLAARCRDEMRSGIGG